MKVLVVGAGPAGLSAATLLAELSHEVTVLERNPAGVDPGWGVTLRTNALSFLGLDKLLSPQLLDGRELWYRGAPILTLPYPPEVGLATVSRTALLRALLERCESAGVVVRFDADGAALREPDLAGYDLVVAADGANSAVRSVHAHAFRPSLTPGENRYAWLGADKPFGKLTILLNDGDLALLAWAYRFTEKTSTFIVECTGSTLDRSGLARRPPHEACDAIAAVFAAELGGAKVMSRGSLRWDRFPAMSCDRLWHANTVLIGDAAHMTHFSQGFGTMFAFDDASALQAAIAEGGSVAQALERYEGTQLPKIAAFQATASGSMRWAEAVTGAADAGDEAKIRELIAARWPNNEIPAAPMGGFETPGRPR